MSETDHIDLKHLFTPGDGGVPPYLAGRKREQEYFYDCVEALIARKPISQNMIVYGPRGNGKTALLRYLQKETLQKEGAKLDILRATPDEMNDLAGLCDRLASGSAKIQDWLHSVEVSVDAVFVKGKTGLSKPRSTVTVRELLRERCREKPFILIVDEAHTLKPDVGNTLLNASQSIRIEEAPFLLILAGTPNLEATLSRANASFWDRSELFPLGRLSPDEAGQAITEPFKAPGISLTCDAGNEIVDRTHCYPFFLQVWGNCLAKRLIHTGATAVTLDTIREVEAEADRKRNLMYQRRLSEIKRMKLLPAAQRVAEAFIQTDKPHLHESVLEQAIGAGMSGEEEFITENLDQLMQLGYVWRVGGEGLDYEPGIPSLMTYVQRDAHRAGTGSCKGKLQ